MYAINKKCLHTIEKCFIICLVLGLGVYDLPKSIDGLMRYMRVKKHISISGSAQKRKLRNMGYYHGYKGYRFTANLPIAFCILTLRNLSLSMISI